MAFQASKVFIILYGYLHNLKTIQYDSLFTYQIRHTFIPYVSIMFQIILQDFSRTIDTFTTRVRGLLVRLQPMTRTSSKPTTSVMDWLKVSLQHVSKTLSKSTTYVKSLKYITELTTFKLKKKHVPKRICRPKRIPDVAFQST